MNILIYSVWAFLGVIGLILFFWVAGTVKRAFEENDAVSYLAQQPRKDQ